MAGRDPSPLMLPPPPLPLCSSSFSSGSHSVCLCSSYPVLPLTHFQFFLPSRSCIRSSSVFSHLHNGRAFTFFQYYILLFYFYFYHATTNNIYALLQFLFLLISPLHLPPQSALPTCSSPPYSTISATISSLLLPLARTLNRAP